MYDLRTDVPPSETVEDVTIAVVGGGSRSWGRKLMNDLALCPHLSGTVRLYDVDYESAERNARLGARYDAHPASVSDWEYRAVDDLESAFSGADFVVCSTQTPPAETMAYDLEIPAEYGIYQTVGDTVGPGGCVRAMRTVPTYVEIGRAVGEHCPDAWVLNYTNPMTVCTRALYEGYPDINAMGICHEIYGVQRDFAEIAETYLDLDETPDSDDIDLRVKGINHFTWVDEARYEGRDVYRFLVDELAEIEPFPDFEPGELEDMSVFGDHNRVAFDLYRRFGAFAAAGDRHLAEFVPWYLDVDDPAEIHRWGIKLTPSQHRIDHWPRNEERRQALLDGEADVELEEGDEEMVDIMCALQGLAPVRTNLNLPNQGQVANLPTGAVVETNALVTADDCTAQAAGRLPAGIRTHVERHVTNQETLVEAAVEGDVDLAYRAFISDPLVGIQADEARAMFNDLIDAQRSYFEAWDLRGATVLD